MNVTFGVVGLIAFVVIAVWSVSLPGDEDEEELAGFVAGNWEQIRQRLR